MQEEAGKKDIEGGVAGMGGTKPNQLCKAPGKVHGVEKRPRGEGEGTQGLGRAGAR